MQGLQVRTKKKWRRCKEFEEREGDIIWESKKMGTLGKCGRIAGCEFQQGSVFFTTSPNYKRLKANDN